MENYKTFHLLHITEWVFRNHVTSLHRGTWNRHVLPTIRLMYPDGNVCLWWYLLSIRQYRAKTHDPDKKLHHCKWRKTLHTKLFLTLTKTLLTWSQTIDKKIKTRFVDWWYIIAGLINERIWCIYEASILFLPSPVINAWRWYFRKENMNRNGNQCLRPTYRDLKLYCSIS